MEKVIVFCLLCLAARAQPTLSGYGLQAVQVGFSPQNVAGHRAIRVVKDTAVKAVDEPTFVRLKDVVFHNGTIEVKLLSRLLKTASEADRGFIGVAFRISDTQSAFEGIYIRPTNGRADSQLRRNRSVQYFSFPDYKFDRLRTEAPGQYETYADMALNQWITMKIVVKGSQARLYLNQQPQPVLVVNDLKYGPDASGGIGLWVDVGTEGFFAGVKIHEN